LRGGFSHPLQKRKTQKKWRPQKTLRRLTNRRKKKKAKHKKTDRRGEKTVASDVPTELEGGGKPPVRR